MGRKLDPVFGPRLVEGAFQTWTLEHGKTKDGTALLNLRRVSGREHDDFVAAMRREAEIDRRANQWERLYNVLAET
jgi:hypothetical protein